MDRLIQFFQPPKFDEEEAPYRAKILTIVLNYLTLALILYIGLAWLLLSTMLDRIWLGIFSLLVTVIARIIMLRGSVRAASLTLVILAWLLLTTWALFHRGVYAPAYAFLTLVVVIATLLLGLRGGLIVALLSGAVGLVFLMAFPINVMVATSMGETAVVTWLGLSFLFITCAGLVGIAHQNAENSVQQAYQEIARRQYIERELRMSEEKFAKAFRSTPIALVISELETSVILDINEGFETLFGFTRAEAIGRKATELNLYTTPEDRNQWQQEFMQKGRIRKLEIEMRRKDGDVCLASLSIEGIELGGVDCVISIVQDVTETKKAEESLRTVAVENARLVTALRHELGERERAEAQVLYAQASLHERETHLRTILDNMPFLIWLKDRNGRYLAVNQAMAEYGGYDNPQVLVGQTGLSVVTPEQSEKHQADDQEIMAGVRSKSAEERVDRQGTSHWFEIYRAPILGDDGAIMGTFGFARDITERKESEASLQESEARFRSVFEDSAIGMILVRSDHSLAKVNHAFCQMLGYTEEELQGQYFIDITHPYDVQISLDNLRALFAGEVSSYQFEKRYVHKQGHDIWVRLNVSAVKSTADVPHYAIAQVENIMARKQAVAERENLIQELERRNGELERFAYTVSHDLKTPLITIGGFLGYLEMDARSGNLDQLDGDIRNIREAVGKMRLLLDELLQLSRIGRLMNPPEAASFAEIVQDALALVHGRLTEKNIRVTVQPDLPTVLGDKARLVEAVQNLVDNAAKYMGEQADPHIWIGVDETANRPVFYVRDNGMGIDPAYQEQIFGLFNKLSAEGEGTGIGLALVKRIVEVHNGRLWVESAGIGQGSTFYFTLNEITTA